MSLQVYSDPSRETDPHALPDVEVFYLYAMPRRAYDRMYVADHCEHCDGAGCDECPEQGWYYWQCFPGCLPDGEPVGPFTSAHDAIDAAQSQD